MKKRNTLVLAAVLATLAAGGYYAAKKTDIWSADGAAISARGAGANAKNRPVTVTTVLAQQRDYSVKLSANGVVSAMNSVEIRPQLASTIARVHIKEGQFVRAGELLFTLDSRADEVNLARAQAQLDKDRALLADQERQLLRNKDLFEKKFVAQSVVDSSMTLVQAQQAVLASDQAALAAAKLALSYTRIIAPSAGRSGIISVYPGSLVQPNTSAAPLVTITQMNPIAIAFALPQRSLPDVLASMHGANSGTDGKNAVVMARLPENTAQFKGKLHFIDTVVDAASGAVKVKAIFDNKEMQLWPGAYANVELSVLTLKDAIVVPQDAVIIGAKAKSVYIVDAAGKAALREVTLLHSFGKEAVITGINAGSKVILEGKQNLRPGALVQERNGESKADKPAVSKAAAASAS